MSPEEEALLKRIYVTGANGMLGRALVPLLEEGCRVLATDLPQSDIRDRRAIEDVFVFQKNALSRLEKPDQVPAVSHVPGNRPGSQ